MRRICSILCVLGLSVLLLGGCQKQGSQMGYAGADPAPVSSKPESDSPANSNAGVAMLTVDEAKSKALTHAGLSNEQVTFVKCKLDKEDRRQVYDMEFYTEDHAEYEYEVNAYTGEIVKFNYDGQGGKPSTGSVGNENTMTEDAAKELALSRVPGATVDDIRKFETDYDDGRVEYEGKIVYDGMEYEFEIDASSGTIRNWEVEPTRH